MQTQKQLLEAELAEAAEYVCSLLPESLTKPVTVESQFIPSRKLGGDCFDYYWLDENYLAVYLLVRPDGVVSSLGCEFKFIALHSTAPYDGISRSKIKMRSACTEHHSHAQNARHAVRSAHEKCSVHMHLICTEPRKCHGCIFLFLKHKHALYFACPFYKLHAHFVNCMRFILILCACFIKMLVRFIKHVREIHTFHEFIFYTKKTPRPCHLLGSVHLCTRHSQ